MEPDLMECLQYQVAEIEALDAAYPQCVRLSTPERQALSAARTLCGLPEHASTDSFILQPRSSPSLLDSQQPQINDYHIHSVEVHTSPAEQQLKNQHSLQELDDQQAVLQPTLAEEKSAYGNSSNDIGNHGAGSSVLAGSGLQGLCELSGVCMAPDIRLGGAPVWLRFQLPHLYPHHAAHLSVDCAASSPEIEHATWDRIKTHSSSETESMQQGNQECIEQQASAERCGIVCKDAKGADTTMLPPTSVVVQRQLIWFHHIKSLTKRKTIVSDARELHLGGASKPGFPGVVVVEGEASHVQDFTARVRALSWQAMQVRGIEEEEEPADSTDFKSMQQHQLVNTARKLPVPFVELPESGMSDLGAMCKQAGLESLFLTALKL